MTRAEALAEIALLVLSSDTYHEDKEAILMQVDPPVYPAVEWWRNDAPTRLNKARIGGGSWR